MLIEIELEKSNYSKIKELSKKFNMVCSNLCVKSQSIEERLKNIEANE